MTQNFPSANSTVTLAKPEFPSFLMNQATFSGAEFANKMKLTRRDRFLSEIEAGTPWPELLAALLAYYPKGSGRGRSPIRLERILRMYIAQQCFGWSDEGIEDAVCDSQAIRSFIGVDLTHESAPDAISQSIICLPLAEA